MRTHRLARFHALCVLTLLAVSSLARAQAPPGYYAAVDPSTP